MYIYTSIAELHPRELVAIDIHTQDRNATCANIFLTKCCQRVHDSCTIHTVDVTTRDLLTKLCLDTQLQTSKEENELLNYNTQLLWFIQ